MMSHDDILERLGDHLDGALPAAERAEMAAHLAGCAECREAVTAFAGLRASAQALPREIVPARDLWPGIAARIAANPRPGVIEVDFRAPRKRDRRNWGLAAAAAVVLVLASSGVTARLMRPAPSTIAAGRAGTGEPRVRETTALAAFRPAEAQYQAAAEQLAAELEARRHQLAPETVEVIEENLRIIDDAIREARAALSLDPSSTKLPNLLSDVYRRKMELLERAIQLPART